MLDFGILESLEFLNLRFSDYLAPIRMDLSHLHDMMRTTHI
jgi:hypothetical protein